MYKLKDKYILKYYIINCGTNKSPLEKIQLKKINKYKIDIRTYLIKIETNTYVKIKYKTLFLKIDRKFY
jgi:hypothetical protein